MKTVFTDLIPDNIKAFFVSLGTPLSDALLVLRTDMREDSSLGDGFIALFKDKFVIAEGLTVFSADKNSSGKVRKEDFRVSRFETFSLEETENPTAEQLISTGRVVAEINGEQKLVFNFSSAFKHSASIFCRAVNDLKKNGELEEDVYRAEDYKKHVCPKCKRRYPDGEIKVCPHCADTARLINRLSVLIFSY